MPSELSDDSPTPSYEPIYLVLREEIMRGDIRPGDRMVVQRLADRFQTSPLPARQALQRLVAEGALTDEPHRGARVPMRGIDELMDLRRVRCAVEGQAAEWAAERITAGELERLHVLQGQMKAIHDVRSAGHYLTWNFEFHQTLYRAAGSPILMPLIERLWLRAGPYLNAMRTESTLGQTLDHHDDVIAALSRGDGPAARRAVVKELSEAAEVMIADLMRVGKSKI